MPTKRRALTASRWDRIKNLFERPKRSGNRTRHRRPKLAGCTVRSNSPPPRSVAWFGTEPFHVPISKIESVRFSPRLG
jgi:hypothetical protein